MYLFTQMFLYINNPHMNLSSPKMRTGMDSDVTFNMLSPTTEIAVHV